jgi:hypothetical protein
MAKEKEKMPGLAVQLPIDGVSYTVTIVDSELGLKPLNVRVLQEIKDIVFQENGGVPSYLPDADMEMANRLIAKYKGGKLITSKEVLKRRDAIREKNFDPNVVY